MKNGCCANDQHAYFLVFFLLRSEALRLNKSQVESGSSARPMIRRKLSYGPFQIIQSNYVFYRISSIFDSVDLAGHRSTLFVFFCSTMVDYLQK